MWAVEMLIMIVCVCLALGTLAITVLGVCLVYGLVMEYLEEQGLIKEIDKEKK